MWEETDANFHRGLDDVYENGVTYVSTLKGKSIEIMLVLEKNEKLAIVTGFAVANQLLVCMRMRSILSLQMTDE